MTEEGWIPSQGTQPGMTKGKRVWLIYKNGRRSSSSYPADTCEWRNTRSAFDIDYWKLDE